MERPTAGLLTNLLALLNSIGSQRYDSLVEAAEKTKQEDLAYRKKNYGNPSIPIVKKPPHRAPTTARHMLLVFTDLLPGAETDAAQILSKSSANTRPSRRCSRIYRRPWRFGDPRRRKLK